MMIRKRLSFGVLTFAQNPRDLINTALIVKQKIGVIGEKVMQITLTCYTPDRPLHNTELQ